MAILLINRRDSTDLLYKESAILKTRELSNFEQVRVGNTDAEGRMAMVDCLCEAKEVALNENNPHLYTIATLTGHAIIAMGKGYSVSIYI